MAIPNLPGPFAYDSDSDADELLEQLDPYIVSLARTRIPRNVIRPEMLADEIEDLIQKVRIKLWLTLRKQHIHNLKAYVRCIVYSEVVDLVRQYRSIPLPLDEDGELYQGKLMFTEHDGMQDPAYEVEQTEELEDLLLELPEAILKLPSRQQQAMICSLKDQLDDVLLIVEALRNHVMNIEAVNWPEEKNELQSLRASLSVARKKLQSIKRRYH